MGVTPSQELELRTERGDTSTTIFVAGEVDYGTASQLRSALVGLVNGDSRDVVVDLTGVTFVDSTALSVLVQGKQRLHSAGQRMSVTGAQPRVTRVLELAGVEDYLVG